MIKNNKNTSFALATGLVALFLVVSIVSLSSRGGKYYSVQSTVSENGPVDLEEDAEAATIPTDARFRYDSKRTGSSVSPDITVLPSAKWTFQCRSRNFTLNGNPPAVAGSTVYYGCWGSGDSSTAPGQGIYALDVTTKAQKWRNPIVGTSICPGLNTFNPAKLEVVGGVLYTTACNTVVAITASSGSIKWSYKLPQYYGPISEWSHEVSANSTYPYVYVAAYKGAAPAGNYLAALDKNTGAVKWQKYYAGGNIQNVTLDNTTLTVSGGTSISSIDGVNGNTKWSRTYTGENLYGPALQYNNLYFGSSLGRVYAVNRDSGADVWTSLPNHYFQTVGYVSPHIAVGKSQVTFADDRGFVYSLNSTNGAQRWKVAYGTFSQGHFAPSTVMTNNNGVVYMGNALGEIKAFSYTNGAVLWTVARTSDSSNFVQEPVVVGGKIFVSNESGTLRAF